MKPKVSESYLLKCFVLVFLGFVIDSTIGFFMPYDYMLGTVKIVPYIGLMLFSMLVRTIEVPERYFYGAICGVYYSIVYSNSLAIYILIYTLIAFVRSYLFKIDKMNLPESMIFCILTIFLQECLLYWLMWITNMTRYPLSSFMMMRVLPTLVLNFVLSIGVYWVYNKVKIEVE